MKKGKVAPLSNFLNSTQGLRTTEIAEGLQKTPLKQLPHKFFYDEKGSKLFDQICEQKEYYITRTEKMILEENIQDIARVLPSSCDLIEYGSGSSEKTKILLEQLPISAYYPIDISQEHLLKSVNQLSILYPHLNIYPISADYHYVFELPNHSTGSRNLQEDHGKEYKSTLENGNHSKNSQEEEKSFRVVYFSGSTIGNFHPEEAVNFLKKILKICGENTGILIGVDLKKDVEILEKAYNDSKGVTKAFNLNLLDRINQETDSNFPLERFDHHAFYNSKHGRIEMHLVSLTEQEVQVGEQNVSFRQGESIWTESSYKYSISEFEALVSQAELFVQSVWTDNRNFFSLQYLKPCSSLL